jgi:hypothetical protein
MSNVSNIDKLESNEEEKDERKDALDGDYLAQIEKVKSLKIALDDAYKNQIELREQYHDADKKYVNLQHQHRQAIKLLTYMAETGKAY